MIEFDPDKNAANIAKHGVSLHVAGRMDLDDAIIIADLRRDYGEPRWIAYQEIGGRLHVMVFTERNGATRAISLGKAMTESNGSSKANGVAEAPREFVLDEDDAPELTEEMIARARPGHEVLPEYILAQFPRSPGRPRSPSPKVQTTIRLDAEVIDYYKAGGPGWQSRMNAALRRGAGFTD